MKKSKLSIGLVTSFIGVLALTACGEVTEKKDTLVTFKGYDGKTIEVLTDSVYSDYRKSSTGVSTYYNAILEAVIRYQYGNENFVKTAGIKTYKEVVSLAENKVKADKATAESNATANSTSYNEEWEKILDEKGVEDEAGLKEYYIYSVEKEELTDWLYETNKTSLTKEYIGLDSSYAKVDSKVSSQFPYHVRHILVNLSGSSTDYVQSTISDAEITNLYSVVSKLADDKLNYLFADIAKTTLNGDTNSRSGGGDVGIVTPSTSFVNEFKLGLYAYDAILSGKNTYDATSPIYQGLGLTGNLSNSTKATVKDAIKADYLDTVPYAVFEKLNKVAKETTDSKGQSVNDNEAVYYPRNIIFNWKLNLHNPFLITNEDYYDEKHTLVESCSLAADNSRFVEMDVNGTNKKVLCDELGRVIVGVRGQYGIHFMVMEKSIFKNTNDMVTNAKYSTDLEQYYSTFIPTDKGFPRTGEGVAKVTYVNSNEQNGTKEYYSGRAETVESAVKGFDSTYDYRLYEALTKDLTFECKNTTLLQDIKDYIENQRISNKASSKKSLNDSWRTYLELLEQQDAERLTASESYKMVPTTCAVNFKSHSGSDWVKGEKCYNAK